MKAETKNVGSKVQVWHFLLHLRWHYQLFILSGGFLLGGFLSDNFLTNRFIFQFFNVHLLLFGGATAYNSFWDKDKGPIGGLKHPPEMERWMWMASLLLQMVGLLVAIPVGSTYVGVFVISLVLFWLYSSPLARWKSHPLKSLIAIGFSTGFNAVLMGYLAAGNPVVATPAWIAAFGAMFLLLSLYPLSQLYQRGEDQRRGDWTFAVEYGAKAVFRFYEGSFLVGLTLTTIAIVMKHLIIGILFGMVGLITGFMVRKRLLYLLGKRNVYKNVMRIKYGTSLAFVIFLLAAIFLKHIAVQKFSETVAWLLQ